MALINVKGASSQTFETGYIVNMSSCSCSFTSMSGTAGTEGIVIVPGDYTNLTGTITNGGTIFNTIFYDDGTTGNLTQSGSDWIFPTDVSNVKAIALRGGTSTSFNLTLS